MAFISRLGAHRRPERLGEPVLVLVLVLVLVSVSVSVSVFRLTQARRTDAPQLSDSAGRFAPATA